MKTIYLLVGVPGSGKSWVCEQLTEKFEYVHHDGYIYLKQPGAYVKAVLAAAKTATRPLLIEAPFSISETKDPVEAAGHTVVPVFIYASEPALRARWAERGTPESAQKGHLKRQDTYLSRALEGNHFHGTSEQVLNHLKEISNGR